MTGKKIFDKAIAIIDELSESGTIADDQVAEYGNRAPFLLDLFQAEMQPIENIATIEDITSLTQDIPVSKKGETAGAYYLAWHFFLADQNTELAMLCSNKFEALKRTCRKPKTPVAITDVYSVATIV